MISRHHNPANRKQSREDSAECDLYATAAIRYNSQPISCVTKGFQRGRNMSGKPIIGIPCYQDTFPQGQRPRFVQYQTYVKAVEAGGGIPILMPLMMGDDLRTVFDR